jgi:hypothetical protein
MEENKYVDFPAPSLINTKIKRNFTIVEINEDCPSGCTRWQRHIRYQEVPRKRFQPVPKMVAAVPGKVPPVTLPK